MCFFFFKIASIVGAKVKFSRLIALSEFVMDLKLISVSRLCSCGPHSFDLSVKLTSAAEQGGSFILTVLFSSTSAAFMLTVNLSGSRCPAAFS